MKRNSTQNRKNAPKHTSMPNGNLAPKKVMLPSEHLEAKKFILLKIELFIIISLNVFEMLHLSCLLIENKLI
jgi:hypothetical protein